MVYVGDRNAFNEIVKEHEDLVSYACDLEDEICNLNGENQRLKNIIYTTLEYVDREEVSSVGTPFTSTSIGKEIKELLEGEKTFNSIWKENERLNNVLNELEEWLKERSGDISFAYKHTLNKLKELKESDK